MDRNTGKQCVQEGKHRNAMLEHGTGTGTRIRTGTGTGTKLETVILRPVLVIPEFECGTRFRESRESVQSCDSGASRADEFQGGTSAGSAAGDVTGSELAEVCQQSHVSVTGHKIMSELVQSLYMLRKMTFPTAVQTCITVMSFKPLIGTCVHTFLSKLVL